MQSISYYVGKVLQKIQVATKRDCLIDPTAKICQRSNLIGVKMGRYSYMGAANSCNNVEIGAFCSIASYCAIGGGSHPIGNASTSPLFVEGDNIFKKNFAKLPFEEASPVHIGNDVWIGEGCFIAAGVSIGDGAIIGAHSVVTRDVDPYAIVAGAPAKKIRMRFDEETVLKLRDLKWWDFPDQRLHELGECFSSPDRLIEACGDAS